MYRIMLIDDEPLIISGISSLIPWEEYDCTIVGKATNGKIAFEQIMQLQPDIIITDIKMPVMNGLELIAKCKEQNLIFSFIVLTNIEEFELAKEAINLGAADYLVKIELTEEILISSLIKVKHLYDQLISSNSNLRVNRFIEASNEEIMKVLFNKLFSSKTLPGAVNTEVSKASSEIPTLIEPENFHSVNIPFNTSDFTNQELQIAELFISPFLMMLNISYSNAQYLKGNEQSDFKQIMTYASGIINEMLGRIFKQSCILPWEQRRFLIIVSSENMISLSEALVSFCQKVNTVLKNYFEITVSIGVSNIADTIFELPKYVNQAITAIDYYYFDTSSPIIFYSERADKVTHPNNFDINFLKKDLTLALQQNDSQKTNTIFEQIIDLFTTYTPQKKQAINACINLYTFIHSFFEYNESLSNDLFPDTVTIMEHLNQLSSLNHIIVYLKSFQSTLCEFLDSRKNSRADKIIELTKNYVKNHYKEKLTLSNVSAALNFSPGYISSSFKKHTGYNFSDYISLVKIENAKKLIDTHNYLMYEISDILGFDNPYYFSKVFKKITGISPREYEINALKQ